MRELCNWKGVNIITAEVCPDHVHMLVEIPPKMTVSGFIGFLKGKGSIMIYQKWGNINIETDHSCVEATMSIRQGRKIK